MLDPNPAAGWGTRFLPQTKAIPKEMQHRFTYTSHISLPTEIAKKYPFRFYQYLVNKSFDLLRKRKHTVQLDDAGEISSESKPSDAELMKQLISECLALIPFEYRSVLSLRDMQGLSYEEIAQVLNISVGTVESRIFRGRRMLKEILMKKGVLKDEMQAI